ncbi:transcriptional regulator HexR [Idiomarina seosinensis]|uniref:Transcriptional regulator HexR n=1 Tax=Idiomarina seosinensis TaxID=281739 RepID=A0A432ZI47_9GAMM|nr:transcriptional regulator HexR [Idiomarina seosinensis]RUO77687.1 transcriptional regulator HexR [Idiomarina seosinensis]
MDLLQRITENLSQFSKSERKVADIATGNPESVIHTSIANMAAIADVSEPTVNRFCRRLDCKGFPDFKLKLAQSLAKGTPFLNRHVEENDSVDELTNKIFDSTLAALNIARQQLDSKPIEAAIDALLKAPKIAFFGFGASASVAHDAQNKFARFDTPSVFSDDLLMQRMWAINSKPDDVLFAISHTGRTKALCEIAEIAQQNGATVIGITTVNSPLAEFCNDVVSSNVPEDTDQYMPMASRIAHLVLIDAIIAGYTLKRGSEVREKLARIKQGLKGSRFPRH